MRLSEDQDTSDANKSLNEILETIHPYLPTRQEQEVQTPHQYTITPPYEYS